MDQSGMHTCALLEIINAYCACRKEQDYFKEDYSIRKLFCGG